MSDQAPQPHALLAQSGEAPICDLLVVGCGNLLRGDDAVGPIVIRTLWERGVPDDVRLIDGGTAGMDVAFHMRGASRVLLVDAADTGAEPGTVYRVPGDQLAQLPPLEGLHSHQFRWDHALAFAAWLLGPQMPEDVTVLLIESQQTDPGMELSEPVRGAVDRVVELVEREYPPAREGAHG